MSSASVLSYLFGPAGKVAEYLTANGFGAAVGYGEKEAGSRLNAGTGGANRVIFMLGDDAGKIGTITAPHQIGERRRMGENGQYDATLGEGRSIASATAKFSVSCWARAADDSALGNDEAALALQEGVLRAMKRIMPGNHWWSTWDRAKRKPGQTGTALIAVLEIRFAFLSAREEFVVPEGQVDKSPPEVPA